MASTLPGLVTCEGCGVMISEKAPKCPHCGAFVKSRSRFRDIFTTSYQTGRCPKCGSTNIQGIAQTDIKGFGAGKGCCGAILLGPFGFLCGLCGMGKGKTKAIRMCVNCGKTF